MQTWTFLLINIFASLCALHSPMASQTVLGDHGSSLSDHWTAVLSNEWDVLGPFSIHAREQHYLSPSYPLSLSDPINLTKSYPSSLADNGEVFWTTRTANSAGELKISFPEIRWDNIRNTEGWAGLQHHSVLRTSITVFPPQNTGPTLSKPPRLLVSLVQGSFFTIIATQNSGEIQVPRWYAGNIYAMEQATPRSVELPTPPSSTIPTIYDLFVSGDYEIRLFGDPQVYNMNNTPVLSLSLSIGVEESSSDLVLVPSHDVVPDFVDGWAFGSAIGVSVRSTSLKWWTVKRVVLPGSYLDDIRLELVSSISIAPTQTRIIPLRLIQSRPLEEAEFTFDLILESERQGPDSDGASIALSVTLSFTRLSHWSMSSTNSSAIKATYFYSTLIPTAFLVKPPMEAGEIDGFTRPPIVALHGAGLDIFSSFWADSLLRQQYSWTIIPSGRTSWGLDWHGPSTVDVWSCLRALIDILDTESPPSPVWSSWKIARDTRVVLIGHSNGGQGAWHISERYPDRVIAVVPAAGYIKSQAYVPLTQSRSAHFIDPVLRSILETALTPDDNDLFLSNLVDTSVLAIHGGDDENVPTWHSRQAVSILKTWNPDADVALKEDPGRPHWYDTVLSNHVVQNFIESRTATNSVEPMSRIVTPGVKSFTLTVAIPAESNTMHGFRIERLSVPGRLSRLQVTQDSSSLVSIRTTNVLQFTLDIHGFTLGDIIYLDGKELSLRDIGQHSTTVDLIRFNKNLEREWVAILPADISPDIQPSGRLSLILNSDATLSLVIPASTNNPFPNTELSYALRISHDLLTYHKLDAEIINDDEAMRRYQTGNFGTGNIVIMDGPNKTSFGRWLLDQNMTDIRRAGTGGLTLNNTSLSGPSMGQAFLHPHPGNSNANILFLSAEDEAGMESIVKLFPIRTGVAVPDWVIVSKTTGVVGAAGVKGAGVWGNGWRWNEATSWLD